ncbi:MAG: type I methionyl aminopeptidase [Candidatus Moranbacteria bacterium RIFOXYB1_FULL_43_19]|nr:MAG: type I methionyl aminopeptidase [Candidatus Moranbacteria bacterium RIFOXYB1_FULL_43_19]OGI34141.1 MAG: type I methionyl aminopeptidase [Candidatus Moranbacteria bacterium RIFOXYC1_FULL_44_13]
MSNISIKSREEIEIMREGGRILAGILEKLRAEVKPGRSAQELDKLARELVFSRGARPSFLGYAPNGRGEGYPAALCVSINDEIVHGIPEKNKIISEGDLVKLDMGVERKKMHTDATIMVGVGKISVAAEKIMKVAEECLYLGIDAIAPGKIISDYACAVEDHAKKNGFSIVRDLVGHGVGRSIHEPPQVLNYFHKKLGNVTLKVGMTLALEPMINEGGYEIYLADDGWTYKTLDGKLNGHWEHTVAVTKDGCEILTKI